MPRRGKNLPPGKEILAPGIERVTVGRGITRRSYINPDNRMASPEDMDKYFYRGLLESYEEGKNFEQSIAHLEPQAKMILEEAGLPTASGAIQEDEIFSNPPNFEQKLISISRQMPEWLGEQGLKEYVKNRGYREREAPEWYAAAIIEKLSIIRAAIRRGDTDWAVFEAYRLGNLVTESRGLGYFEGTGREGGKRKRRTLPIPELVRYLIRKNKQGTATYLWEMIPKYEEDGIRIGEYKFYRKAGQLLSLGKLDGRKDWRPVGKPIQFRAFQKRVGEVRKPSTR